MNAEKSVPNLLNYVATLIALVGVLACKPSVKPGPDVSHEAAAGLKKKSFIESALWAIPFAQVKRGGDKHFTFQESQGGYPYLCFYKREFNHSVSYNPRFLIRSGNETSFSAAARENFLYLCSAQTRSLLPYPIHMQAFRRAMDNWKAKAEEEIKAHFWGNVIATTGAVALQMGLGMLGPVGGALGMSVGFGGMHLASSRYNGLTEKSYKKINLATVLRDQNIYNILSSEYDARLSWVPNGVQVSSPFFGDLNLTPEQSDFLAKELKRLGSEQANRVAMGQPEHEDFYSGCEIVDGKRVCGAPCAPAYNPQVAKLGVDFFRNQYAPAVHNVQKNIESALLAQGFASAAVPSQTQAQAFAQQAEQMASGLPAFPYQTTMEPLCQALFAYTAYGEGAQKIDQLVASYGLSINVANGGNHKVVFTPVYYGHPKNKLFPKWAWDGPVSTVAYEVCRLDKDVCVRKWKIRGQIEREAEVRRDGSVIKEFKTQEKNPYSGKVEREGRLVLDFGKPGKYPLMARAWVLGPGLGAQAPLIKESLIQRKLWVRAHAQGTDARGNALSSAVDPLE